MFSLLRGCVKKGGSTIRRGLLEAAAVSSCAGGGGVVTVVGVAVPLVLLAQAIGAHVQGMRAASAGA
jgi:hypothetical protein